MSELLIEEEMTSPCDTRHLVGIRDMVKQAATRCFGEDRSMVAKITLAVDEAVANVMEHAYEGLDPGDVRVAISADDKQFVVTVTDQGHQFDPGGTSAPDLKEHFRKGKRDGLGIFLMRQIMDEIKYTFIQNKHNELRMVKYVGDKENS